uniref:Uncharacterized protein n=1 Tax=Bactrocera dorsalis TaxID=27457 RepID=A0A034VFV9_BACDO
MGINVGFRFHWMRYYGRFGCGRYGSGFRFCGGVRRRCLHICPLRRDCGRESMALVCLQNIYYYFNPLYLFPRINQMPQVARLCALQQNTLRTNSNFTTRNAEQLTSVRMLNKWRNVAKFYGIDTIPTMCQGALLSCCLFVFPLWWRGACFISSRRRCDDNSGNYDNVVDESGDVVGSNDQVEVRTA